MEFAALADKPDHEEDADEIAEQEESPGRRPVSAWQVAIPLGLLLLVALIGIVVYTSAKRTSSKAGQAGATVSPVPMPPIDRHANADSPFGIPGLQQGPLDSVLGIG